mmetsp:Transcript_29905/g.68952  ORF Transcript_29905/g.68952 Transcript_29905/m.68952 type:complete len:661 (+) Transcript_29905:2-1984(+)
MYCNTCRQVPNSSEFGRRWRSAHGQSCMPRGQKPSAQSGVAETLREVREKTCAQCFAKTERRCEKCKQVWFCSDACFKKGWLLLGHKSDCGLDIPRPELPPLPPEFHTDSIDDKVISDADWVRLKEAEVPAVRPRGMYNVGNTCYLNSSLQCLAAMPCFSEFFRAHEAVEVPADATGSSFQHDLASVLSKCQPHGSSEQVPAGRPTVGDWVLVQKIEEYPQLRGLEGVVVTEPGKDNKFQIRLAGTSFAVLVDGKHLERSVPPADPKQFVRWVPHLGESFTFGAQEDAHEFSRSVLRALGDEQLREFSRNSSEPLVGVSATTTELTAIPARAFGGVLISQCACPEPACGYAAHGFEAFQDLSLEITEVTDTIEEMLQLFTAPERLDKNNKWLCEGCNKQVRARKRLLIHKSPTCLVLHLKRFRMGFHGKINKPIKFDTSLNLRPFMSSTAGAGELPLYDLRAVIVHLDKQNIAFSGHYVAYVKYPDPSDASKWQWYILDDEKCMPVPTSEVLQQTAYLLFYTSSASSKKSSGAHTTNAKNIKAAQVHGSTSQASTSNVDGITLQRCAAVKGCPFFAVPGQELCSKCYRERYNSEPPKYDQDGLTSTQAEAPVVKEDRATTTQPPPKAEAKPDKAKKKIGPNEPCPCGSGAKYKKCHGAGN